MCSIGFSIFPNGSSTQKWGIYMGIVYLSCPQQIQAGKLLATMFYNFVMGVSMRPWRRNMLVQPAAASCVAEKKTATLWKKSNGEILDGYFLEVEYTLMCCYKISWGIYII